MLMSGAAPGAPMFAAGTGAAIGGGAVNFTASTTIATTTAAAAATIHGSLELTLVEGVGPTGAPQTWQKRTPGCRDAWHLTQLAPPTGVPQWIQYLPDVDLPQRGHDVSGCV